ncbi:hypothetical protein G1H11_14330 [Phytoactinopolyspora alkaliphila]|uniref:Uncharacterized protein n=1 Tax=Phytoactinopolyspora alkaliphila TaxID=1783498 RepID=A0A6N9YNC9_9ACTN|nr:hypothetical protein [Phytoactinopolyspora alkaliphila]NED96484.1 hypothetical protein [Phytoactinopolyspora alkaliphila]
MTSPDEELDPDVLRVELEYHHAAARRHAAYARRSRDRLLQALAERMTPEQRRAWIRQSTRAIKAVLIGACGWFIEQARDHTARSAVVSATALVATGSTQVIPTVIERPPLVIAMEQPAPEVVTPEPPPSTPEPPAPTVTTTTTATATATATETVTATPHPLDISTPEPTPTATVPQPTRTPKAVAATTPPDTEPMNEPTFFVPENRVTMPPTVPTSTPTATPTPTRSPDAPPAATECVELPERTGVSGTVCEPPPERDPDGEWLDCLQLERLTEIMRCVRNPDKWFT